MKIENFNNIIKVYLGTRCDCGKYNGEKYRGVVCDSCGIEVKIDRKIIIKKRDLETIKLG